MTTVSSVMDALRQWLPQADGLTISGGEPFEQPTALHALLAEVRRESNVDVLVYSGYAFEEIMGEVAGMKGLFDALISDPFKHEERQTLPLRGSDNQRLHLLTPLGEARFAHFNHPLQTATARFDVMVDEDGTTWLAGIPGREDFARLQDALAELGHEAVLSVDRRSASPERA
jgi:anaerobic ribonucleoside-triphosphate reductase activating protein